MPWPADYYKYSPESLEDEISQFVLKPLFEAYDRLKSEHGVILFKEDDITSKIVYYLKHYTSISEMCARHSVDVVLWPTEQPDEDTENAPDIKFDLPSRNWLHVEAKRVYEKAHWSIAEYLGPEGIGRILSDKYSIDDPYAAMLCYIQNGDFVHIRNKVKNALIPMSIDGTIKDVKSFENCCYSNHDRKSSKIGIFHLFFYFNN
jgi:hypothetical protein